MCIPAGVCNVTYTIFWITVDENLPTPGTTNERCNLSKFPTLALLLDLERLIRDLVPVQPRGILPAPQHECRVCLLGTDNLLLDVLVDGCLDGAHETRAHVNATSSEA